MQAHETDQGAQTEDQAERRQSNRARVRQLLIKPLQETGLVRQDRGKGRVSAAAHDALLEKMQARLGWMDDNGLRALRAVLVSLASGPALNYWPKWATIWNHATRLRPPPEAENTIMTSWLHSCEGPRLRAAGTLVETYLFLRDKSRPPSDWEVKQIRSQASDNAVKRARVIRQIDEGNVSDDDRNWFDWYNRALAHCETIVAQGEAHRRAGQRGDVQ
ncbi:MAG TPA: hypothetical protein ENK28_04945 [Aliiroseovarius sp.]|nr:hypothetical protein [Aliiroseovarius sp.]